MNAKTVCETLEVSRAKLNEWIAEGLPWSGKDRNKQFDEPELVSWLLSNGKAELGNFTTVAAEAARELGVSPPQFSRWTKKPGFPGWKGYYPIDEIRDWRAQCPGPGRPRSAAKIAPTGQVDYAEELRRLRVEKALERLIDVRDVNRETLRAQQISTEHLGKLSATIEARLPSGLPASVVNIILSTTKNTVDAALGIISEMLEKNT
jgi:hypothetical protein